MVTLFPDAKNSSKSIDLLENGVEMLKNAERVLNSVLFLTLFVHHAHYRVPSEFLANIFLDY